MSQHPLVRLLRLAAPFRWWMLLAALLGVALTTTVKSLVLATAAVCVTLGLS